MTPRQMYSELAKIAGHGCGDNRPFLRSQGVSMAHIKIIQRKMRVLLEKINYERTCLDFPTRTETLRPTLRPDEMYITVDLP